jgi:hypothetical protein
LVAKKNNELGATPKTFREGSIFLTQGDRTNAQKCFQLAQPAFETTVKEAPDSADRHANLGWLYVSAICVCPTERSFGLWQKGFRHCHSLGGSVLSSS